MADKTPPVRKKPVSQKRVAVVLASLVGTMTLSAGTLLLMEGSPLGASVPGGFAMDPDSVIAQVQPAVPLQPNAWNYIIIYESGDVGASADTLADGRVTGGFNSLSSSVRPTASFHFVIDGAQSGNGTVDGKLEVGPNWKSQDRQLPGAPYAAWPDARSHLYTPYTNAVGVCLAADLSRRPLSEAQYQTLLQTIRELQRRLDVPSDHVLFHWDPALFQRDPAFKARQPSPAQRMFEQNFRNQLG
jgi:hypothetical protein